jgi:hypothetical protein
MSPYVLAGNGLESTINGIHIPYTKIHSHVLDHVSLVGQILENDAKNISIQVWQTSTFVTMKLKYMEEFACVTSMII